MENFDQQVIKIISEVSNFAESKITPDSHLAYDLGIDSLDMLRMSRKFDKRLGINFPSDNIAEQKTVKDVIDSAKLLNEKVKHQPPRANWFDRTFG